MLVNQRHCTTACNLEEKSSESSYSDTKSDGHWAKVCKQAAREGDWELARKPNLFAACVQYKRGRNLKWESISYRELKKLCKAAKHHGHQLPYFKNFLTMTYSAHTLMPHDVRHVMSILLSPTELLLWETVWKQPLLTGSTRCDICTLHHLLLSFPSLSFAHVFSSCYFYTFIGKSKPALYCLSDTIKFLKIKSASYTLVI